MKLLQLICFLLICLNLSVAQLPVINNIIKSDNSITFVPLTISSDIEVGNPSKGFYQWEDSFFPNSLPKFDVYKRFSWRQLEIEKGIYDFSLIDQQLAALEEGQQFAFRVMPLNTCCTHYKNGADVPVYIYEEGRGWFYPYQSLNGSDSIFVPDWNDTVLIGYMKNLNSALSEKYEGDPRIGWIENGLYGNWGEWHTYPIQYPDSDGSYLSPPPNSTYLYAPFLKDTADTNRPKFRDGSVESKNKILLSHTNVFKKTRLIQSTGDLSTLFEALRLNRTVPIGIRRDSWGDAYFTDITMWNNYEPTTEEWTLFNNQWKIAPFYTENWGGIFAGEDEMIHQLEYYHITAVALGNLGDHWNSLPASTRQSYLKCGRLAGYRYQISEVAADQDASTLNVSTKWKNSGISPCYNDWFVIAYLESPLTGIRFSNTDTLGIILNTIYDNKTPAKEASVQLSLLPDWDNEQWLELRLIVMDRKGFLQPMNLDLTAKNTDGSYTLFSIENGKINNTISRKYSPVFEIFPNPASTILTIDFLTNTSFDWQITDIVGKKISINIISESNNQIHLDISSLPNGLYLLILKSNNSITVKKFRIQS